MSRRVPLWVSGVIVVAALIAVAGCSHNFYSGEREAWRREAEVACLNSGAVKEGPERVRITAISGPGMCGADYPIRVSALGESAPLSYDDEPLRPPAPISSGATPRWPIAQPESYPPSSPIAAGRPSPAPPAPLGVTGAASATSGMSAKNSLAPIAAPGRPLSLYAPGVGDPHEDDAAFEPAPPQPYDAQGAPTFTPRRLPPPGVEQHVPLGWPRDPVATGAGGPVEVKPAATLACPLVSALDQWITASVQPAALRWFRTPVVEIKQISAYSCRGMNGNPNAHISEHAFGNALDIAEFTLADGHRITVQYGWHGSPEEQGFLHDVQLAACDTFSTVLAPGANIYHYNHIHVDLMRRASRSRICQPAAIPGNVVAEQARARYAGHGDPSTTGSIAKRFRRALGYAREDDERLPPAVPGED